MKKILTIIFILLIILFITLIYSRFIGTTILETNEIVITDTINESYNGLKIVHFSDLHYKKVITENKVKEIIKEINKLKPDLVIFTGDLINKDYQLQNNDINFLIEQFSKITSKYGCYSLLGDNDNNEKEIIKNIYIQSNFTIIDHSYNYIYNEANNKILISDYIDETIELINDPSIYKILLTHFPDNIDTLLNSNKNINLILAGHSLNGSINIPYIKKLFLPTNAKKYYEPHYRINNTNIYISNGIGVDKINFRLFNHPSINFYRIKNSN